MLDFLSGFNKRGIQQGTGGDFFHVFFALGKEALGGNTRLTRGSLAQHAKDSI
ncbi:MAG: hypothetical protein QM758_13935 [Armatimonas sp.]